jgi:ankyrin repeat protein
LPGGDGQTPLHFAARVEIAGLLLEHGAAIDALDVDHVSTPAQYMVRDRQEVARYLVERGCRTDLLMLTALGDQDRIVTLLDREPGAIRLRVTDEFFPMIGGPNSKNGGTIYQWTLGWYVSSHDVALQFGHREVHHLLLERSPVDVRFLLACWAGDLAGARKIAEEGRIDPRNLSKSDRRHLAHAVRNNNVAAATTMLELGFPIDGTSQHGATALHWAVYHGSAAMTKMLLTRGPALEQKDADFDGPPMGWLMHGSREGWHRQSGDYAATVELLLAAGAKPPVEPRGSPEVMAVLRRFI